MYDDMMQMVRDMMSGGTDHMTSYGPQVGRSDHGELVRSHHVKQSKMGLGAKPGHFDLFEDEQFLRNQRNAPTVIVSSSVTTPRGTQRFRRRLS